MQINRNETSPSFGLQVKYSKQGTNAYRNLLNKHPEVAKAFNSGKDKFATITQKKGIKGQVNINRLEIIEDPHDKKHLFVQYALKAKDNTVNIKKLIINSFKGLRNNYPQESLKSILTENPNQKLTGNFKEMVTTKFMDSLNK